MKKELRNLIKGLGNDERGTAFIEFTAVLPVLLSICLGVFEFGNAIFGRHLIENGVRDAARYAAGLPHDDATAIANARNIAVTGVISGGTKRVSWWDPLNAVVADRNGTVAVTYTPITDNGTLCGAAGNLKYCRGRDAAGKIYVVTVSGDIPYQGLGFMGYFGLGNLTMHVQHQERLFGVR